MEEPRRYVRLPIRTEVAYVVLPSGTTLETQTRDISSTGMRLVLDHALAPGTQLQVAVALPGVENPVNAIAEVVWSQEEHMSGKAEQHRSVQVGIRCTEISPQDQQVLNEAIAQQLR